jgi:hypothetical protein
LIIVKVENLPADEYSFVLKIQNVNANSSYLNLTEKLSITKMSENFVVGKKFPDYEFRLCEGNSAYPFSGTSFLTYQILCEGKNTKKPLSSGAKPFLDLILVSVPEIRNLTKDSFTKSSLVKITDDKNEYIVGLEITVHLDDMTKVGVMTKINDLFIEVLKAKAENEKKIEEFMESFKDIGMEVKSILDMQDKHEKREECCACMIL